MKYFIGIDFHQSTSSYCVLNENGKLVKEKTIRGSVAKIFADLKEIDQPMEICFEASNGYGYIYDHLCKLSKRVVVAHPGHLRMIFHTKRKNDRIDAQKLAKLLYLDTVPQIHVPNFQIRDWRRLISMRQQIVSELVRSKNRLRSLLRNHCLEAPKNLWSKKGMKWFEQLLWPSKAAAMESKLLSISLSQQQQTLKLCEKELNEYLEISSGAHLLMTIPGIGPRTAEAIMAHIDKPQRFNTSTIGSYFGLVPCQDSSAGRARFGHITKQGPPIARKLLTESVWQAIYRSPEIKAKYEHYMREDPDRRKIALVATAHWLLRVMLTMLLNNEPWRYQELKQAA